MGSCVHILKSWQKNIFTEGVAGSETYSADAKLFSGIEKLFTCGYLIESVKIWEYNSSPSSVSCTPLELRKNSVVPSSFPAVLPPCL